LVEGVPNISNDMIGSVIDSAAVKLGKVEDSLVLVMELLVPTPNNTPENMSIFHMMILLILVENFLMY